VLPPTQKQVVSDFLTAKEKILELLQTDYAVNMLDVDQNQSYRDVIQFSKKILEITQHPKHFKNPQEMLVRLNQGLDQYLRETQRYLRSLNEELMNDIEIDLKWLENNVLPNAEEVEDDEDDLDIFDKITRDALGTLSKKEMESEKDDN